MQTSSGFSIFLRVLLPFLVAVTIDFFPAPHSVVNDLRQAAIKENQLENEAAAVLYQKVLEMQPWRSDLWEKTGSLFYESGSWTEVAAFFGSAYEQGQLSIENQLKLGEAFYQIRDYDRAVEVWSGLLTAKYGGEDLFARVADMQNMMGSYDALVSTYQQWIAQYPENADIYYRLGLLLALRDPANASPMLTLARTFDPNLTGQVNRLAEALETVNVLEDPYRSLEIGRAMSSIGEWELASQAFETAVETDPGYGEAWALLAEAYQHLGMPSYQAIQKANALSPDSVVVKAMTAVYWRRQNDPDQAIQVLDEIIALEPDEEIWLVEKGYALAQSGDLQGAIDLFYEAIEREPEQPAYRQELIRFCLQNNYEVRAVALPAAREYLLVAGETSQSLDMMGWVMLALQDTTSAWRYLARALEKDSANASAHLHLGLVLLAVDEGSLARFHLDQAASMEKTDPQSAGLAKELLQRYFPDPG